jgi:hypothetical protein
MYVQKKNHDTQKLSHFMQRKKPAIHKRRVPEAVFMEVLPRGRYTSDMHQKWFRAS